MPRVALDQGVAHLGSRVFRILKPPAVCAKDDVADFQHFACRCVGEHAGDRQFLAPGADGFNSSAVLIMLHCRRLSVVNRNCYIWYRSWG